MFSQFFIDHPRAASVLSIVLVIAGAVAVISLSVEQYPPIVPPTVQVSCVYPGANAQVVADTVAAPIEQQVNGVEGMLYMSSQSTNDGSYNLTITFGIGADLNMAQVLVQNRVSLAMPQLPNVVQRQGVNVKKKSPNITLAVNLTSPDESLDQLFISNYATIQVKDELLRLPGVGDLSYLGQRDYSMRAWLDPEKLATRDLTAVDVANAVREQNVQVAAGNIGQEPVPQGQEFQLTMSTLGRLRDPKEFADIIIKSADGGKVVYLKDVARIELGSKSDDQSCTLDSKPSVGLAIFQLPGTNALKTADAVYRKMEELKQKFPKNADGQPRLKYEIVYDTTVFVRESILEVFKTLRDAIILVAVVVLVFLQNWRATIIPLVAVPVSIVGTFAVMAMMGFTLNNLTLFGLVLAIGIVVDDAIVVVENVERWLAEGLSPREAAVKAMGEVTGPVIAVALVLCAVFVPSAFISGITGQFFRQFALTIAVSTVISAFNSLTLSPALCAVLLEPHQHGHDAPRAEPLPRPGIGLVAGLVVAYLLGPVLADRIVPKEPGAGPVPLSATGLSLAAFVVAFVSGFFPGLWLSQLVNGVLSWFFRGFNRVFDAATGGYVRGVGLLLRGSMAVLAVYAGLLYLTWQSYTVTPKGFIPSQDKGYLLVNVQLPDASSVQRTREVLARVDAIARETPGVVHTLGIAGQSFLLSANSPNFGSMFVILDKFHNRHSAEEYGDAIAAKIRRRCFEEIQDATVAVFGAPAVDGLGSAGGFKLQVEDRGNVGLQQLQGMTDNLVEKGNAQKGKLVGLFTTFRANTPQLYIDIDRTKAKTLQVSLSDVFDTLQINLGSMYVNDFNEFGRTWQVNLQADAAFRARADDVKQLKVRSAKGQMVPLGTLAEVRDVSGPVMVMRYNMYPSAAVNGGLAPGFSTGDSIELLQALADQELPRTMTMDWTELTFLQVEEGRDWRNALVFPLAVVLVLLVLTFQYESWSLPLAVILIVPMCILCAVAGVLIARMDINIFTQIGFVVLVGLAAKNAILIVEFAKQQREAGKDRTAATLEACRLRLRPILMTSFAFGLGVLPLVVAAGAGAEMRRALGTAVFAGMVGVTVFGIFLTPVFYVVIDWVTSKPAVESKKTP
jgi:multidrug efflux pump